MRRLLRCGALGLAMLVLGCSSERSTGSDIDEPTGMYIDEPIVLAFSDSVEPVKPVSYYMMAHAFSDHRLPGDLADNEFVFDFSDVPLVTEGRCNDFLISYKSLCRDLNLEVWDDERRVWRKLGFRLVTCDVWSRADHYHMLSVADIPGQAALDDDLQLRVRFGRVVSPPKMWALEINPEYEIIPDFPEIAFERWGLAFAGDGFYYASLYISYDNPDDYLVTGVYHTDLFGITRPLFQTPGVYPYPEWTRRVASDGENLWVSLSAGRVLKMNEQGDILCSFTRPGNAWSLLTWDGTSLWMGGSCDGGRCLINIDPKASCKEGQAVVTRTVPIPVESFSDMAWDGSHFLLAGDSLYQVALDGTVRQRYDIPLMGVAGVAWDGSRVCILSHGPPGPGGRVINEMPISCFRLR